MDTLHKILSKIDRAQKNKESLSYQETIALFNAIKQISVEKSIIKKIIDLVSFSKDNTQKIKNLSRRESEIFKLIGLGFSSREISETLSIQETTVSTHRKHIIKKLEISGSGKLHKVAFQHLQTQV